MCAWQRAQLPERTKENFEAWKQALGNPTSSLEVRTDFPRSVSNPTRGASERFVVDREVAEAIRRLARRTGMTPFIVLLTALQALLHRITGEESLVVGIPVSGRDGPDLARSVGFYVNTCMVRSTCEPTATLEALLQQCRESLRAALTLSDAPLEWVIEQLRLPRKPGHTQPFQTMFVLDDGPPLDLKLPGVMSQSFKTPSSNAKFDLTFELKPSDGAYEGQLVYRADLFHSDRIHQLARGFELCLKQMVCRCLHGNWFTRAQRYSQQIG